MLGRYINKNELAIWLSIASTENTSYFRARRQLWDRLKIKIVLRNAGNFYDDMVEIPSQAYTAIWSTLTSRNEKLNENQALAFMTSLEELMQLIEFEDENQQITGQNRPGLIEQEIPVHDIDRQPAVMQVQREEHQNIDI